MKAIITLSTLLIISSIQLLGQSQKGSNIYGEIFNDFSGWSVSMGDANTMAIGAPRNDGNGNKSGHVRIYNWNGLSWIQKGIDINGEAIDDQSGSSVSMPDANTVAIGAPYNDGYGNNSGHTRIYRWNGTAWLQKGLDINGENANDNSGVSVSMPDSNTVAIGAPNNNGYGINSGHVRIYKWNGSSWIRKGLDIDGEAKNDSSGMVVCMPDSNTIAIGAPNNDGNGNNSGQVRIYKWNGSSWIQKGIDFDGGTGNNQIGSALSMPDSSTLAIGTPYNNNSNGNSAGRTIIYKWNGTSWIQKGIDIKGSSAGYFLGSGVSMPDSNTIAIGEPGDGNGRVRVFKWNGSVWIQKGNDMLNYVGMTRIGYNISMVDTNSIGIGDPLGRLIQVPFGASIVISFCDSTSSTYATFSQTVCNQFISPSGNYIWNKSGIYKEVVPNATGCDSVITVNLTVNNSRDTISPIVCLNYISPSGMYNWINSGIYNDTISNSNNCDSIITINLTVKKVDTSVSVLSNSLTANAFSASYQWVDCTNNFAPIAGQNNQFFNPTTTGNYAVIVGKNGCTDTSQCYNMIVVGLHENKFSAVRLYPNPTNGKVTIDLGSNHLDVNLKVNSIDGQLVQQISNVNSKQIALDLSNYSKGIYFVTLQNKENLRVIKLVKN